MTAIQVIAALEHGAERDGDEDAEDHRALARGRRPAAPGPA
jgi:hypothetical protein